MQKCSKIGKEKNEVNNLVLWSNLGLIFLLAALSCLLCKCAQTFWPLFVVSILGLITTFYWNTTGFLLGFGSIIAALCALNVFELWNAFFSVSILFSWWLLLLGRQAVSAYCKSRAFKEQNLEDKCLLLQKK